MSKRYAERLSVGELAEMAHMSIPTFHQHFKAMTATSPLQYMKSLRLTHARQMLQAGARVKAVAHDVGYESESQFSREYRRFFGFPPSGDGGAYVPGVSGRASLAS
jgi:AraC-like DNA-binding protein